jgi:hypothetical protein
MRISMNDSGLEAAIKKDCLRLKAEKRIMRIYIYIYIYIYISFLLQQLNCIESVDPPQLLCDDYSKVRQQQHLSRKEIIQHYAAVQHHD